MKFVVLMDDKELKFLEVFDAFEVPLGEGRILTHADMFSQTILAECGIPMESEQVANASSRTSGPVAQLLRELKVAEEKYATLESENQKLRAELHTSNAEIYRLKDQLVQQQLANNARVDRVLDMLASAQPSLHNLQIGKASCVNLVLLVV